MRKSEVFDNFIKIAEEKGMIDLKAPDKAKKILENNPRADSLDISAIEALYGVKPDAPKDMGYEQNIMERAHPNSLVISPSYDKVNGLIENNIERHNIMLNIVNKTPDGLLNNRKLAEQDLTLSLVRIGNDLDNKNQNELMSLADTCLMQVSSTVMKKEAFIPLLIAGVGLLGALYFQQHANFVDEGFETNHQKLMSEIEDLIGSSSSWGVGTQYTQAFTNMVNEFKTKLDDFYALYKKNTDVINEMEKPKTGPELAEMMKQSSAITTADSYNQLKIMFEKILPYIQKVQKDFSSESYKAKQVEDKGFFSSLIDKVHVLHGGKGALIADDFDDVARAIDPYIASVKDFMNVMKTGDAKAQATMDAIEAANKSHEMFDQQTEKSDASTNNVKEQDDLAGQLSVDQADLGSIFSQ